MDKKRLAWAIAGDEGTPGSQYEIIRAFLFRLESDPGRVPPRYQCLVDAEEGSNQGHLEAHREASLEGRGDQWWEAIDAVRDDLETWDDWLTPQERRQLLRSLEYELEDA